MDAIAATLPNATRAPRAAGARPVTVFGVTITDASREAAMRLLDALRRAPGPGSVYFVNAHTLNLAAADPAYREVLNGADLVFGDGTGVRWAARARGVRLQANLVGTDLVPDYLESRPGQRVFLLGGTPEQVDRAGEGFRALFPQTELVGVHHGYLDDATSQAAVAAINAARPDLLLVGMGNPLQERWIARWRDRLDARLCLGVGGVFAYWAGSLDRAPLWLRRQGFEWLHILRRHPHKARRYLVGNAAFLLRLLTRLPADRRAMGSVHAG
jgi:N-acetylglucosaminyldiphosphoundecaprenol N-acetyl-beta-D-mannosaminyltransferase